MKGKAAKPELQIRQLKSGGKKIIRSKHKLQQSEATIKNRTKKYYVAVKVINETLQK